MKSVLNNRKQQLIYCGLQRMKSIIAAKVLNTWGNVILKKLNIRITVISIHSAENMY